MTAGSAEKDQSNFQSALTSTLNDETKGKFIRKESMYTEC